MGKIPTIKHKILSLFLVLVFTFIVGGGTVSARMYQPGETLEPDCAPSSSNCGVVLSTSPAALAGDASGGLRIGDEGGLAIKLDGSSLVLGADGLRISDSYAPSWSSIANGTGVYIGYKPNNVACNNNEVLKYDAVNSHWLCGTDAGTSYIVGTGLALSGSTLTSSLGSTVESSEITDGTITDSDISASAGLSWGKINKTGVKLSDFDVPSYSSNSGKLLGVTPDGTDIEFKGIVGESNKIIVNSQAGAITLMLGANVATLDDAQTLTNKTLTDAILNGTLSGTAIDTDATLAANSNTKLATQRAIKAYVDTRLNGLAWRPAADVMDAATANPDTTIIGQTGYTVDGTALANGMRVLFTAGSSSYKDGVYVVGGVGSSITLTLATDGKNGDGTPATTDTLFVEVGAQNGGKNYTYSGGAWVLSASLNGSLVASENLSDLYDVNAARANLGLGQSDSPTLAALTLTGGLSFGGNLVPAASSSQDIGTAAKAIRNLYVANSVQLGGADLINNGGTLTWSGGAINLSSGTSSFGAISTTGDATVGGALSAVSGLTINSDKFTVDGTTGNAAVAGALSSLGGLSVNTNKFTVNGSNGDTSIAGKLTVGGNTYLGGSTTITGLSTINGLVIVPANLPSSPTAGMVAIDSSDSNKLKYYNGTGWVGAGDNPTLYATGGNGFGTDATLGTTDDFSLSLKTNNTNRLVISNSGATNVVGSLSVNGTKFGVDASNGNTTVGGSLSTAGSASVSGNLSSSGNFSVNTNKFTVNGSTGNTNVAGDFGVTGSAIVNGALAATNGLSVNTDKFTVNGTTGETIIAGSLESTGGLTVNTNKFTVNGTSGNTNVAGTLGVGGSVSFGGTLGVAGDTTFSGDAAVNGVTSLTGILHANGGIAVDTNNFTVNGANGNTTVGGTLSTGSDATVGGTLSAANGLTINTNKFIVNGSNGNTVIAGTLNTSGNTTVGGTLGVAGDTTFSGNVGITGAATLNGLVIVPANLPASPATGAVAVDSTDGNKLKYFNGTGWVGAGDNPTLFANGGNGFGATANIGTTDNYGLNIKTNGTTRLALSSDGVAALTLADDNAGALAIKVGSDKYIAVNSTNGSESITFGNAVTNPNYTFLGSGTVYINGNLDANGKRLINIGDPINSQDAVTKAYADNIALGLSWKAPVLDKDTSTPPGSPATGARYIVATSPTGAWAGHSGQIVEWNGTDWAFTALAQGIAVYVTDEAVQYTYNGSAWVNISSTVAHNNTTGLQGGVAGQYYHLDQSNYTKLTAIGALTPADGKFLVSDGSGWVAESGDTARTSLGLGTGDTPSFTGVMIGAGGLTINTSKFTVDGSNGNVLTKGNLSVNGDTALTGNVAISGVATLNGLVIVPTTLPATPAAGQVAIDSSDSNKLKFYSGTAWVNAADNPNYFANGGNSFGVAASLGTKDNNELSFKTNDVTRLVIAANGNTTVNGSLSATGDASVTGALTSTGNLGVNGKFGVDAATGNTNVAGSLAATGGLAINTNKFTVDGTTGNTNVAGTLGVNADTGITGALALTGGFSVNTDKFTIVSSNGNTAIAGLLGVGGNLSVATDKFTVAAATGNTTVGGTLGVAGVTTLAGLLNANGGLAINTNKFTVAAADGNTTIAGTLSVGGEISGPTTANTINGLVINSGALSAITGLLMGSGNFAQSGTGTFSTGTGAVALNGDTTVASGKNLILADSTSGLRFNDADGSNYVGFKAPATVAANTIWSLPNADGSSGQVLTTNGAGGLNWSTPTSGGSSSTTTATFSTSVSAGDLLQLTSSGTVTKLVSTISGTASAIQTVGSGSQADTRGVSGSYPSPAVTYVGTNGVVMAYFNGTGIYVVGGTISDTNITWGTPQLVANETPNYYLALTSLGTDRFALFWNQSNANAVIGRLTGTAITTGSVTNTVFNMHDLQLGEVASDKLVGCYRDSGTGSVANTICRTINISNLSITFGSSTYMAIGSVAVPSGSYHGVRVTPINTNQFIVTTDTGSYTSGTYVGTVSGDSISFTSSGFHTGCSFRSTARLSNGTGVDACFGSGTIYVNKFTMSGSTINYASDASFANLGFSDFTVAPTSSTAAVLVRMLSGAAYARPIDASATNPSLGSESTVVGSYFTEGMGGYQSSTNWTSKNQQSGKFILAYRNTGASNTPYAVLGQMGATTQVDSGRFYGIAQGSYAAGAIGTVATLGQVSGGHSGLTAGSVYYIQANGTLGTTATSYPVGWAINSTQIMLNAGFALPSGPTTVSSALKLITDGSGTFVTTDFTGFTEGALRFYSNNTERMTIDSNGRVGISASSPSTLLAIGNTSTATGNQVTIQDANGTCTLDPASGASWVCSSDRNLKTDILSMDSGVSLDKIMRLNPSTFTMRADGSQGVGFIAQEVQGVIAEAVGTLPDGNLGLDATRMIPYIVGGIKAQQAQITALRSDVDALKHGAVVASTLDNLTVKGLLAVEGNATFTGKVAFKNQVTFNSDTAGNAIIKASQAKIEIKFKKPLDYAPIINVTPSSRITSRYWVDGVSNEGFTINIDPTSSQDATFNWTALIINTEN